MNVAEVLRYHTVLYYTKTLYTVTLCNNKVVKRSQHDNTIRFYDITVIFCPWEMNQVNYYARQWSLHVPMAEFNFVKMINQGLSILLILCNVNTKRHETYIKIIP